MKIILVTSDLTYVPQNYDEVLEFVIRKSRQHIAGIILAKINKLGILAKLPYLYLAGCKNMANTLASNIGTILLGRKKKLLRKYQLPFIFAGSINDARAVLWLRSIKPDLILNMRARCMYKEIVLKIPRLGCVNVHHGILPYQKGLFCDLYALADNRRTGFSIHKMTNHIDQGQILYREEVKRNKTYIDYLAAAASKEKVAIVNFIEKMAQSNLLPEEPPNINNHPVVTTTPDFRIIKQLQRKGIIL